MWKADRMRATLTALALAALLTACSGTDDPKDEAASPTEVLAAAAATLTETSGVEVDLTTSALPEGVSGIAGAQGVVTSAPAFEGSLSVVISGMAVDVPVVGVDGVVHAKLPFTTSYAEVDPSEYGAPDPAGLISAETGFPALLEQTEGVEQGDSSRGGENNTIVLTTYTGTVPGSAVKGIIPSASGDSFDVTWLVSDDDELRRAELTGVFYPDSDSMTYVVSLDDYGTEQEITAP